MLTVDWDVSSKDLVRMVKEWPIRTEALRKMMPFLVGFQAKKEIESRIPSSSRFYKMSLRLAGIQGLPGVYVVTVKTRRFGARKIDPMQTLLYVRERRGFKRKKGTKTLEEFSPWTALTIPFMPRKTDALIVARKVGRVLVDKVGKKREQDKSKWRVKLARQGVRVSSRASKIRIKKSSKAISAVALEALRMEFGLGGAKPKAHWRPGINVAVRSIPHLVKDKKLVLLFTEPSFIGWKEWPPKTSGMLKTVQLKDLVGFQQKLGIKLV
jgi:hypothetical protein